MKNNFNIYKDIKKCLIISNIHILKPNLYNKYFYIEILKKIFNIYNRKNLIKILDLQNQKKTIIFEKQLEILY